MTQDTVTARDIARSLPGIAKQPCDCPRFLLLPVKDKKKDLTLGTLVEHNASKYPSRPAIKYEDREITYADFNAWANRIAHYLRGQGLKKGDAIAVFLENRPELLAVVSGAAKIGVACAMLNTSQKGRVLEHSINLIKPRMVVVGEELIDNFEGVRNDIQVTNLYQFLADSNTLNIFGEAPDGFANVTEQVAPITENPVTNPPKMGDTAICLYLRCHRLAQGGTRPHQKFVRAYGNFGRCPWA